VRGHYGGVRGRRDAIRPAPAEGQDCQPQIHAPVGQDGGNGQPPANHHDARHLLPRGHEARDDGQYDARWQVHMLGRRWRFHRIPHACRPQHTPRQGDHGQGEGGQRLLHVLLEDEPPARPQPAQVRQDSPPPREGRTQSEHGEEVRPHGGRGTPPTARRVLKK